LGPKPRNGIFVYLGTGAPWQALDRLALLWKAIHRIDKSIRFRVISRDNRTKILGHAIAPTHIEFVGSDDSHVVARYLHESEVGFLIRRNDIVNVVSFPTKLAEYLAAGCWVVTTRLDWDITDLHRQYQIGYEVGENPDWDESAKDILSFRTKIDVIALMQSISTVASKMEKNTCIAHLKMYLRQS
jgi:hypothetical protein